MAAVGQKRQRESDPNLELPSLDAVEEVLPGLEQLLDMPETAVESAANYVHSLRKRTSKKSQWPSKQIHYAFRGQCHAGALLQVIARRATHFLHLLLLLLLLSSQPLNRTAGTNVYPPASASRWIHPTESTIVGDHNPHTNKAGKNQFHFWYLITGQAADGSFVNVVGLVRNSVRSTAAQVETRVLKLLSASKAGVVKCDFVPLSNAERDCVIKLLLKAAAECGVPTTTLACMEDRPSIPHAASAPVGPLKQATTTDQLR